jgi:hypothetical protein
MHSNVSSWFAGDGTDNYVIRDKVPTDIQAEIDQLIEERNDIPQDGNDEPLADEEGKEEGKAGGDNTQGGRGASQSE